MPSNLAIDIQSLRKTYREGFPLRRRRLEALRGVSLQVPRGEVFGLLGPNGAGKTTLIKVLLGIVSKSEGSATLLDHPAGSQVSRQRVGYLPENLRLARHHTARSALHYFGQLSRMDTRTVRSRSDELLETVGLAGRDRESVRRFSKGMGQRLGLAQALLHDPELLILDEPTDGLDPVGRSQVREIISRLKAEGKTIFLNSHILQEVELVCDRFAILAKGQLRAVGTIDELRSGGKEVSTTIDVGAISNETAITVKQTATQVTIESLPSDRNRISLSGHDQPEIDRVIDLLRIDRVSIFGLHQGTSTLEDIFLSLVGNEEDPTP